ncbi:MAG TPA: glycosyltransferase [Stellaceae bacterium]
MRRVLLLSTAFPPDNVAAAARAGQLFSYLPENNYQPVVVASTLYGSHDSAAAVHRVPEPSPSATVSALAALGRGFTRYCAPYEDRWSWVPHAVAAAMRSIGSDPVDAIFSTSPSLGAHFAALWLKLQLGLPWIADFQDPIRDNPARSRNWIYPYDALVERRLLGRADRLAANTDTVAAAWRRRYPQWSQKISILWNCFDPAEPIEPASPPARSYRVLAHIGALYGGRHPGQLLTSLERLGIAPSDYRVRLVGPAGDDILAEQGPLLDRMRAAGLLEFDNCLVPREEATRETVEADYLVLLDLNELPTSFQVPSKLVSYVRAGKPILAWTPKDSPVERILAQCGIPYVAIDPSSPAPECDRKVAEFLKIAPQSHRPSAWFRETFDARSQARQVARLLDELLAGGGAGASPAARRSSASGRRRSSG